jgi:hypothetical protein
MSLAAVALAVSASSAVAAGISLALGFRESKRRDEELMLLRGEAVRRGYALASQGGTWLEARIVGRGRQLYA